MNSWSLQYQTPTMPLLLDQLKPEHRTTIELVRDWLGSNISARPKLEFTGIAWRWNERYDLPQPASGVLRCVCLIPDPQQPRVAICCDRTYFEQHPPSSIPKPLHAGLSDGVCVGSNAWCTWGVGTSDSAGAIIELLEQLTAE